MIFDKIENLRQYDVVSDKVLEFILNLDMSTPTGRCVIDEKTYANIEEYNTKPHENCFFEAHKRYIDIQLLLKGEERLDVRHIDGLTVKTPYDDEKDLVFFENRDETASVKLQEGSFALLFPHDAHRPQMCLSGVSECVKKVVVKILVS